MYFIFGFIVMRESLPKGYSIPLVLFTNRHYIEGARPHLLSVFNVCNNCFSISFRGECPAAQKQININIETLFSSTMLTVSINRLIIITFNKRLSIHPCNRTCALAPCVILYFSVQVSLG